MPSFHEKGITKEVYLQQWCFAEDISDFANFTFT